MNAPWTTTFSAVLLRQLGIVSRFEELTESVFAFGQHEFARGKLGVGDE